MSALPIPVPAVPEQVINLLEEYLAHAQQALTAAGVPATRVQFSPGQAPAWDDCCDGQLWVRLTALEPWLGSNAGSGSTVGVSMTGRTCGPLWWVATVELGVLRCAATVDSRGNPPTAVQVTVDGQNTVRDALLLLPAVSCHPATLPPGPTWTPLPTDGGCTGGQWTFACRIDNCPCP